MATQLRDTSEMHREVRSRSFTVASRTVLWAAGVAASSIARSLGTELDKAGRVRVTPALAAAAGSARSHNPLEIEDREPYLPL